MRLILYKGKKMKTLIRTFSLMALSLLMILNPSPSPVEAGTYLLTNNGDGFRTWTITGETTLVMNGFDLRTTFQLTQPITIDTVRMSVAQPVVGQPVEAVIYQDFNGGNPNDAALVTRQTFTINDSGVFIGKLTTPVQITAPVVWVGFYMPVGFKFRSDQAGTSVLTYWGWTPNATFDLSNLRTATVFGPSDGTEPVNINMSGVARITAEITPTGAEVPITLSPVTTVTTGSTGTTTSPTTQIIGSSTTNLSPMVVYPNCPGVFYDTQDIIINYRDGVRTFCNTIYTIFAIPVPTGYRQVGLLHDISLYGIPPENQSPLPFPITHCIRPLTTDTTTALIGIAYGTPRRWEILPTVRFNDLVCAEMRHIGFISYFLPQR